MTLMGEFHAEYSPPSLSSQLLRMHGLLMEECAKEKCLILLAKLVKDYSLHRHCKFICMQVLSTIHAHVYVLRIVTCYGFVCAIILTTFSVS